MTRPPPRLVVVLPTAVTLWAGCAEDYYRVSPAPPEAPPNALRVGVT